MFQSKKALFHHCIPLEKLITVNGDMVSSQHHSTDDDAAFIPAYTWWHDTFGFWPIFLAVGNGPNTLGMTGYPNQFGRVISSRWDEKRKRSVRTLRPKGDMRNYVLLSFEEAECLPHNFDTWENIICFSSPLPLPIGVERDPALPPYAKIPKQYVKSLVGQTKRKLSNWIKLAKKKDGRVQACAPRLDMTKVIEIKVRNQKTKKLLENIGYQNVEVLRVPAPKWY